MAKCEILAATYDPKSLQTVLPILLRRFLSEASFRPPAPTPPGHHLS